jgi:hypothetical protein
VHFYSSFWRFLRLNSGAVNCFRAGDAARRARAPAPPLPRRSGPPSRVPRPPFPRPRAHRGRLGVLPLFLAPRAVRPANARRTVGRSGAPPAGRSCRGRRVLLGVRRRSLGHWHARGRLLNEADALPRSRPSCSPPGTPWLSTAPSSALARPSDTPSTFPCAYPDSPVCPSPPQRPTSPARQAAAATRPGRRHRPC